MLSDVLKVTELGIERQCNACGEWWPLDREFYHLAPKGLLGFKARCRACEGTGSGAARVDDDRLRAMLENGWRIPDIAVALGYSRTVIYQRQKAYREKAKAA